MRDPHDPRLPLRFGPVASAGAGTALLIEGDAPAPPGVPFARFVLPAMVQAHPAGCACCVPRGPVAAALASLFLARARGGAWFTEVLAVPRGPAGEAAIRATVAEDVLAVARFRIVE